MEPISELKSKIDFGIITVRQDEFEAVLRRFPPRKSIEGRRRYAISSLTIANGEEYAIAMVRCPEQGTGEGQHVARDLIDDLDPQWLLLVGIAGALPSEDYTLGDVIAAVRLHDFTVSAYIEDTSTLREEFSTTGGPMHRQVQDLVAHLPALRSELAGWNSAKEVGHPVPAVRLTNNSIYGDSEWRANVRRSLQRHLKAECPFEPRIITGSLASSDRLVKDTKLASQLRRGARQILAFEMELAGVYRAARQKEKEYPLLAIRGVSDIVGLKRTPEWTVYACDVAASFTKSLLKTRPIPPLNAHSTVPDSHKGSSISTETPSVLHKRETLISNLQRVVLPEVYYAARTSYLNRKQVWAAFDALSIKAPRDWIAKNNTLLSFHDLDNEPWSRITSDVASYEKTLDWETSPIQSRCNDLVELMNNCLIQKCEEDDLNYDWKQKLLYFAPTPEKIIRSITTKSLLEESSHEVVSAYGRDSETGRPRYYRHHAFKWKYYRLENNWYLEITPTYFYTTDGQTLYWNHENLLKGMKRMETNAAVLGQVLMWADYLRQHGGMFALRYEFLKLEDLVEFKVNFGIDDEAWKKNETQPDPDQLFLPSDNYEHRPPSRTRSGIRTKGQRHRH